VTLALWIGSDLWGENPKLKGQSINVLGGEKTSCASPYKAIGI